LKTVLAGGFFVDAEVIWGFKELKVLAVFGTFFVHFILHQLINQTLTLTIVKINHTNSLNAHNHQYHAVSHNNHCYHSFHRDYLKAPTKKLSPSSAISSVKRSIKSLTVSLGYISPK
jgi:hypothetical protein